MRKTTAIVLGVITLLSVACAFFLRLAGSGHGSLPPSRVEMEIMQVTVALETYRADHEHYPSDPNTTERIGPNVTFDPVAYITSSEYFYLALAGRLDPDGKRYFDFKPEMLRKTSAGHPYLVDPNGNSFGYSTRKAAHPESLDGENPTFDLWSTGGGRREEDKPQWHKNW